jgi:hypothetical protein
VIEKGVRGGLRGELVAGGLGVAEFLLGVGDPVLMPADAGLVLLLGGDGVVGERRREVKPSGYGREGHSLAAVGVEDGRIGSGGGENRHRPGRGDGVADAAGAG